MGILSCDTLPLWYFVHSFSLTSVFFLFRSKYERKYSITIVACIKKIIIITKHFFIHLRKKVQLSSTVFYLASLASL